MNKMIKRTFNKNYFLVTIILFLTEVGIALFINDDFIRPYFGDTLVVILIYCFIKSFFTFPVMPTAIGVLLFSYFIETLQYIRIVHKLGWQDNKLASTVIGTAFAWEDLLAYTAGIILVLLLEGVRKLTILDKAIR
jgi:hypothetical protein